MPELPEVETIVRDLRPHLIGQTVTSVQVDWPRAIAAPEGDIARFVGGMIGRRWERVWRRGKFILVDLDNDTHLIVHLRMSGRLVLKPLGEVKHLRAEFHFDDGLALYFYDPRRFGRLWLVQDVSRVVGDLGPEPLSEAFTAAALASMVRGRRGLLKPLLLDQRFIAGLGNIYVDESLFRAGLHPQRRADTLVEADWVRLHSAIRAVLKQALEHHGTSFDAVFVRPEGESGRQQEGLRMYGQAGLPCAQCGTQIVRIVVGGRGTHLCPHCQSEHR
ncbi:MAG: bifunctional DNA-formamidopyrimidine glycosylase/DNA-(apurinic or apyrimidinic site) lyase [Anaerolineae bacterium]|nr:bifunctional DNA-formamidopyrimidine glycosylase/DNA-(apurinic or apyrimidinic site) lyase [Anaerolineae bacterium]